MEFVFDLVVVLHFVGLALLLGAFLVQVKDPNKTVTRWMWDGALTQLLTGVIMVGMISSGSLGEEEKERKRWEREKQEREKAKRAKASGIPRKVPGSSAHANGSGAMPSFGGQMSDDEIETLAQYIVQVARK